MAQEIRDSVSRVRMSFEKTGENLIVDCRVEPGGGLPPHYHPRQEERWSVVEGRVGFRLGDSERVIGPVDGEIVVEPGSVHAVASVSESEAHLRCVVFTSRTSSYEVRYVDTTPLAGVAPRAGRERSSA